MPNPADVPEPADESPEVEGFFFQALLGPLMSTRPPVKIKAYDFSSDTIEGDLVRPEGSPL